VFSLTIQIFYKNTSKLNNRNTRLFLKKNQKDALN